MAGNGGFQASSGYNDRPPSSTGSGEADLAVDPASSTFFNNEFKRYSLQFQQVGGANHVISSESDYSIRIVNLVWLSSDLILVFLLIDC